MILIVFFGNETSKECFACGKAYYGAKIADPIDPFDGTAEDCHALCVSTEGCNFFLYQKWNVARCVLKSGKGNVVENSNSVSGSAYKCRNPGKT